MEGFSVWPPAQVGVKNGGTVRRSRRPKGGIARTLASGFVSVGHEQTHLASTTGLASFPMLLLRTSPTEPCSTLFRYRHSWLFEPPRWETAFHGSSIALALLLSLSPARAASGGCASALSVDGPSESKADLETMLERGVLGQREGPVCQRGRITIEQLDGWWRVALELDGRQVYRDVLTLPDAATWVESWLLPLLPPSPSNEGAAPELSEGSRSHAETRDDSEVAPTGSNTTPKPGHSRRRADGHRADGDGSAHGTSNSQQRAVRFQSGMPYGQLSTQACFAAAHAEQLRCWSQEGSGARLPAELLAHVSQCEGCSEFLKEVQTLREVFSRIPEPELEAERLDTMRFTLMAAARRQRRQSAKHRDSIPGRQRWPWAAVAAAAVLLATATSVVLLQRDRLAWWPSPTERRGLAQVTLAANTVGEVIQSGAHEVYALQSGVATFVVPKLAANQHYRVVVGNDSVEVRGTRFQVVASGNVLQSVRVQEGRVVVRHANKTIAELKAGQEWLRDATSPDAQVAAAAGSVNTPTEPSSSKTTDIKQTTSQSDASERSPTRKAPVSPSTAAQGGRKDSPSSLAVADYDAAFQQAWRQLHSGHAREAAAAFDSLSRRADVDVARRGDALYWSARAYEQAGAMGAARARAKELAREHPDAWHAPQATELLEDHSTEAPVTPLNPTESGPQRNHAAPGCQSSSVSDEPVEFGDCRGILPPAP